MAAIFTMVLAVGVAGVVVPAVSSEPAGAVPEAFTLDMIEGGGLLELRDQEPYEIEQPTTLEGTVDTETGVVSGASFSTPTVSFEMAVTEPVTADVFIDAVFSEVDPGTGSGAFDHEGNLVVDLSMIVDLHIEVVVSGTTTPFIVSDCVVSPVDLLLDTVTPYDENTGRVTVAAPNFTVPEVEVEGCNDLLIDPINDALAGDGHAITLTLQGDLTLPPEPGEPSDTTLVVDPADSVGVGEVVTMTATVVPGADAEPGPDPTGFVDFRRGNTVIATVPISAGTAELETSALPAGNHALTAQYRGDGVYRASTSDPVIYQVVATPLVVADLPSTIQIADGPVEFDVTVTNTGLGSALANARLDLTFRRAAGNAPILPATGDEPGDRITLARIVGETVEPIELSGSGSGSSQRLLGSIGPDTGAPLPPGGSLAERLRLDLPDVGTFHATSCGATNKTCPGLLELAVEVIPVDPEIGVPVATVAPAVSAVASTVGVATLVEAERRPADLTLGETNPFTGNIPPASPHTVRQGGAVELHVVLAPTNLGGIGQPTRIGGRASVQLDGQPILAAAGRAITVPDSYVAEPQLPPGGVIRLRVALPRGVGPGPHELDVNYLGNAWYLPAHASTTIQVLPALGPLYDCTVGDPLAPHHFRASLVNHANVPGVRPAGTELVLGSVDLQLLADRGPSANLGTPGAGNGLNVWGTGVVEVGELGNAGTLDEIEFVFGPDGSGTANATSREHFGAMGEDPVDETNPVDQVLGFPGATGSVLLDGAPGEVIPVTVDRIDVQWTGTIGGFPTVHTCVPLEDAAVLGEVTLAGTTLSASASTVQPGESVTLTAEVLPEAPGIVVFSEGAVDHGVVPVSGTTAATTVEDLAIGAHDITATFFPSTLGIPSTTSDPVTVTVIDMDPAFSDVPEDSPFFDAIQWLAQEGITTGFADGSFQPAAAISRDAVAAWLWRYAGEPVVDIEQQFSDVPPEHPFYDAIQWMAEVGITTGFEDGTFRPASNVHRDAVAAFLWRFAGEPENTLTEPAFSDVGPEHPFYAAIQWMAEVGITTGFPDGTFQPASDIERQAVAAWLFRLHLLV